MNHRCYRNWWLYDFTQSEKNLLIYRNGEVTISKYCSTSRMQDWELNEIMKKEGNFYMHQNDWKERKLISKWRTQPIKIKERKEASLNSCFKQKNLTGAEELQITRENQMKLNEELEQHAKSQATVSTRWPTKNLKERHNVRGEKQKKLKLQNDIEKKNKHNWAQ
jgi:hypothetical protein